MPPFAIIQKLSENMEILNARMNPERQKTLGGTQVNFQSTVNIST